MDEGLTFGTAVLGSGPTGDLDLVARGGPGRTDGFAMERGVEAEAEAEAEATSNTSSSSSPSLPMVQAQTPPDNLVIFPT